ncbi:hypothetical protein BKD03_16680 [Brucella sp. 09RB8471]|nr:hypothetical protein BKD03_16680 [Brucella sp. 09RB8471]
MVRFPAGMMDRIKAAAAKNHRSMNAEIIARLEQSLSAPISDDSDCNMARARRLLDEVSELISNAENALKTGE